MDTTLRVFDAAPWARYSVGPHVPTVPRRTVTADFELSWARPSDHPQIHRLLLAAFQEPTRAEFQALNEAPRYDSADRLIVRRRNEIAAHVQLVQRRVLFGGIELPTMDLKHLATLPEYRSLGLARGLHDAAMEEVRRAGVMLATVSARHPNFFASMDWFRCGRYSYSEVEPRSLIATLQKPRELGDRFLRLSQPSLSVHVWRRHELDALTPLYEQVASRGFGLIQRLESDWQWLIRRGAFDYIYVVRESAAGDPQCPDESAVAGKAVGYAIVRDGNLLEIVAVPDDRQHRVIETLLARVCRDALENGRGLVRVHAPPDHPVHAMVEDARGCAKSTDRLCGRVAMAQVTRPAALLLALRPLLKQRATRLRVTPPVVLNLQSGDESLSVSIGSRTVSVSGGKPTEHVVNLPRAACCQMLLGHASAESLLRSGEAQATSRTARDVALHLFPRLPLWRPQFEDEPA